MRLLVVSHTPHYRRPDGTVVGWGATVRELDYLASRCRQLFHLAPMHDGEAPGSSLAYSAANVELIPVPPAGGARLRDKFAILARYPGYLAVLRREIGRVDAIHVRCPANLSMLAISALALWPGLRGNRPWWVKYAGNWSRGHREPRSYQLQRAWLRRPWSGLTVTVNGRWPDQSEHIRTFDNPCLTSDELSAARAAAEDKSDSTPTNLLFVGVLDENKGADRAIEAVARLASQGFDTRLDIVGDGPLRARLEGDLASALGVGSRVRFHGAQPRPALDGFYRRAHLLLVPSRTEGWPKVVAEGMAYGVVPIATAISCIPQILDEIGVGACPAERTHDAFASAIAAYLEVPDRWREESRRAAAAAERFTYDRYLDAISTLFEAMRMPDPEP